MKLNKVVRGAVFALTALSIAGANDITLVPTGTITGSVQVNGGVNSDVPVYVNGTSIVGFTSSNGTFTIEGVPVGTHSISASLGGATGSVSSVTIGRVGDRTAAGKITLDKPSTSEKDLFVTAEDKYARGDYEGSRSDFRQLTSSSNYGEISKYRIGISFYLEDLFDDALRELATVSSSGAFGGKAAYFIGRAKEEKRDIAGAESEYRKVIENYGGTDAAIDAKEQLEEIAFDKGFDAYLVGNYSTAITEFDSFLSEFPGSEDEEKVLYYLGKAKESQLDGAGAISTFEKIPSTSDRYLDARVEIARIKTDFNSYSSNDAISEVNAIINHDRTSDQAKWAAEELGDLKWDNGDTTGAITAYETVLRDFAENREDSLGGLFTLGYKQYLRNDFTTAINWLTKYCELGSTLKKAASGWYYIGRSHEKQSTDKLNPSDPSIVKAKEAYNKVINSYGNSEKRDESEERLAKLP